MADTPSLATANPALIDSLLSRNPALDCALAECAIIDDVLCNRIMKKKSASTTVNRDGHQYKESELAYLPKGRMEMHCEYTQRISMTPWFPKLPQVLNDRQGALFSSPPKLTGDLKDDFTDFEKSATNNGESLVEVIANTSALMQRHGFCGVFIDRAVMPEDVAERGGVVSEQERKERKLGEPKLVVFRADQIADLERDNTGLRWVKTIETEVLRGAWSSKPFKIHTVRIYDRARISVHVIRDEGDKKVFASDDQILEHGFDEVPFVIVAPFRGEDGIGRPSLLGVAQADVSATRILSDIVWNLFVLGNPILTFKTDRSDEELQKLELGATRYVPLANGKGTKEPEALEFVQLDSTGLELQFRAYESFAAKAAEQAGKDAPGAITQPLQEKSGISRAWEFKTGQERILFLITRELQQAFNKILDFAARIKGIDPEKIGIEFNDEFDMTSPADEVNTAASILPLVTASQTATAEIKKRVIAKVYPDLPNMADIVTELDASAKAALVQTDAGEADNPSNLNTDQLGETLPPAIDTLGKTPLGLQQLALARERANTAGDKKLSAVLAKKQMELAGSIEVAAS